MRTWKQLVEYLNKHRNKNVTTEVVLDADGRGFSYELSPQKDSVRWDDTTPELEGCKYSVNGEARGTIDFSRKLWLNEGRPNLIHIREPN